MGKEKICVVTGSRAEYGLLHAVMRRIQSHDELDLQIVVTGMHLSSEFGRTYQTIEADGFEITEKVEMLVSSDSAVGVTKSMGLGMIGFADVFQRLNPNMVVVLGDRFEILSAAVSAFMARIPIVHIGGGDVTEGALDESIRHSITKMAQLHFVTNEKSRSRVCQLGEDPKCVFHVGHLGIERIQQLPLLSKNRLEERLDFSFQRRNLMVTYHPVTLGKRASIDEFEELLNALHQLGKETGILFTKPNADPEGRLLTKMIDDFQVSHPHAKSYASLGQLLYFSSVQYVDAVIGNSSSGIYEVPSLAKPTVDIGDRQKGRMRGSSVIHCEACTQEILEAIDQAYHMDCSQIKNPYGDGTSSSKILKEILKYVDNGLSQPKPFFEVEMKC